jgi:hypothetical protein
MDALKYDEQTVMERVAKPGRRMRPVCAGAPGHDEKTIRERV